eukprot:5273210-Prymnesium_polylepis.4
MTDRFPVDASSLRRAVGQGTGRLSFTGKRPDTVQHGDWSIVGAREPAATTRVAVVVACRWGAT